MPPTISLFQVQLGRSDEPAPLRLDGLDVRVEAWCAQARGSLDFDEGPLVEEATRDLERMITLDEPRPDAVERQSGKLAVCRRCRPRLRPNEFRLREQGAVPRAVKKQPEIQAPAAIRAWRARSGDSTRRRARCPSRCALTAAPDAHFWGVAAARSTSLGVRISRSNTAEHTQGKGRNLAPHPGTECRQGYRHGQEPGQMRQCDVLNLRGGLNQDTSSPTKAANGYERERHPDREKQCLACSLRQVVQGNGHVVDALDVPPVEGAPPVAAVLPPLEVTPPVAAALPPVAFEPPSDLLPPVAAVFPPADELPPVSPLVPASPPPVPAEGRATV